MTYHYLCSFLLQSPLKAASKNGHTEVVAMLLKAKGIDVNKGVSIVIRPYISITSAITNLLCLFVISVPFPPYRRLLPSL